MGKIALWNDSYYVTAYEMAQQGKPLEELKTVLQVSMKTLERWFTKYPVLKESWERGKVQHKRMGLTSDTLIPDARLSQLKKWQRGFIRCYRVTGNVKVSCEAAGIARFTHYTAMKTNPEYAELVKVAEEEAGDEIEREMARRGMAGIQRLKFYKGAPIMLPASDEDPDGFDYTDPMTGIVSRRKFYIEHEYSDACLIVLAKARRPEKFRENSKISMDVSGSVMNYHDILNQADPIQVVDAEYVKQEALKHLEGPEE